MYFVGAMKPATDLTPGLSDRLLRAREAAEVLAISERQVWNLARAGELELVRLGRSTRFRASSVRRLIRAGAKGQEAANGR